MKRPANLISLACLFPLCCAALQEQPAVLKPSASASPGPDSEQRTAQGTETCAALRQQGLPLPPTAEEITALPYETAVAHSRAIKRTLLEQMLRAKEENRRVSPENLAFCAQMADKLQAPPIFGKLLRLEASQELSPRDHYAVREGLARLYQAYRVDELALRYFAEGSGLPADAQREAFSWLPIENLFNLHPSTEPSEGQLEADYVELGRIATEAGRIYNGISNQEQADAAALALAPLLSRFGATSFTRDLAAGSGGKEWLNKRYDLFMKRITETFQQQRVRVRQENFYGSDRLRAVDYLFE